jgi:hypothetical protein
LIAQITFGKEYISFTQFSSLSFYLGIKNFQNFSCHRSAVMTKRLN